MNAGHVPSHSSTSGILSLAVLFRLLERFPPPPFRPPAIAIDDVYVVRTVPVHM